MAGGDTVGGNGFDQQLPAGVYGAGAVGGGERGGCRASDGGTGAGGKLLGVGGGGEPDVQHCVLSVFSVGRAVVRFGTIGIVSDKGDA